MNTHDFLLIVSELTFLSIQIRDRFETKTIYKNLDWVLMTVKKKMPIFGPINNKLKYNIKMSTNK